MAQFLIKFLDDVVWPLVILLGMWIVFWANQTYHFGWNDYGIHPRSLQGLFGILAAPFLHGDFHHLFSNSTPFLVGSAFLFYFFPKVKWKVLVLIYVFSGLGVWLYAHSFSNHIGASGMVYGLMAFLFSQGIIKNNRNLMGMSLLLAFLYGGMIWGLFPQFNIISGTRISWEGHLSGAITGVVLAFIFRNKGPQDDPDPFEDDDDEDVFLDREWFEQEDDRINFRYRYKPSQDDND
jgi:membrane associated rhomboid family serine protease